MALNLRSIALLVPVIIAAAGLITGASWLIQPTPGWVAMPMGNLCLWIALISLALITLDQAHRKKRTQLRYWAVALLAFATAWAPLGYLASGNWRFSFSADNTWLNLGLVGPGHHSWLALSAVLAGVLLCCAILALTLRIKPDNASTKTITHHQSEISLKQSDED